MKEKYRLMRLYVRQPLMRNFEKGGVVMKYSKPIVKRVEVVVKVNTNSSERSSCDGGHCVRARYGQDH